ncbi:PAS domain S-box-containing protein [Hydrogenispora ethanolica]|uniref:histidine kinase n=1 Tax=Hydrogenispora ethanolica TaxID=1082276 RepID=A0A4R1S3S4_HYDET|nr:ATP-binding protein [Hydrogenispora ethanolica]TCL73300.1 PAS domain S-box-containing protein [Hydrogenispora ethanolica]
MKNNAISPNGREPGLSMMGLVLLLLVGCSLYRYSLFHLLAEVYGIFLAFSIFSITWNVRRFMKNPYLLFLGVAFLFSGVLSLVQLLLDFRLLPSGLFVASHAQLFLTLSYVWSGSLLIAPLLFEREFSYPLYFGVLAGMVLAMLSLAPLLTRLAGDPGYRPVAWVLGILIFLLLTAGSLLMLFRQRRHFDKASLTMLTLANVSYVPAIAVLFSHSAPVLVVIHLCRLMALTFYYHVVVRIGLLAPYQELKQSEAALAAEKERLDITLKSLGEGVIATDNAGRVCLLNKVAEELTGWTQAEALGRPLPEVYRTAAAEAEPVPGIGRHPETPPALVLTSRDQHKRFIAASGAAIRDHREEITGQVYVFRDITVQQKMAEEFLKNQKLKSLGILAGGMAHDFHNILAVLLGNVQLAKLLLEKGKDIGKYLDGMEESIKNAARLTKQLLTFSKGGTPIKHRIDLGRVIAHAAEFALKDQNVQYQFLNAAGLWPVEADEGQIGQVVHNLLINAAQAMPDGGLIRIQTENVLLREGEPAPPLRKGSYVKLVVEDHGCGIAPEHLPHIFDPFFTTRQSGNGLGLATAYSIIARHEGCITVDSKPGRGTLFAVYLPACLEPDAARSSAIS